MGTKKKAEAEPVETPAAEVCMHADGHGRCQNADSNSQGSECCGCEDRKATNQPALAAGMIWTDPRDGQKFTVVAATGEVACKGCHFFDTNADCPASDLSGSPVCETASVDAPVKFLKVAAIAEPAALKAGDVWTHPETGVVYDVRKHDDKATISCGECSFGGDMNCPNGPDDKSLCLFGQDTAYELYFAARHSESHPKPRTAPAADLDQVPKVKKGKTKKAAKESASTVPSITGLTTCQMDIPAANLVHASWNKRGVIEPDSVADLVASIKAVGLIQRVVVRADTPDSAGGDRFVILAGHRRYMACMIAGLDPVPCDVVECDEKQSHMITAVENMHRTDLTAMQEAEVVEDLIAVGYSAEEVAEQTGWHLRRVYRRASLKTLTPVWRNAAHAYGLCGAFLEEVSRLPAATQGKLYDALSNRWNGDEILHNGGNVKGVNELIARLTMELSKAPWTKKHPEWCASCDRCSNANPNLFDETEVGDNARCLDNTCWEQRKAALVEEQKAELEKKHGEVRTASDQDYRYGKLSDAKGRKDKNHSVPVVITDGDNAGKTVWVAGAADKAAAKERGETVLGSKQPSLEEKRQAWVIRKVREMIEDSRKKGSLDNPFERFDALKVIQTLTVTGTQHSNSWHNANEWECGFKDITHLRETLWGRVAPVLIARMSYPTIADCGPYYEEAVSQALWLFAITQTDLDAEAADAIKDKSKKGA